MPEEIAIESRNVGGRGRVRNDGVDEPAAVTGLRKDVVKRMSSITELNSLAKASPRSMFKRPLPAPIHIDLIIAIAVLICMPPPGELGTEFGVPRISNWLPLWAGPAILVPTVCVLAKREIHDRARSCQVGAHQAVPSIV